jgi:hypothetical protein
MSRRVKAGHTGSRRDTDMGARALEDYQEVQRRQYHERIRQDLVDRGAIVESVKKLLEEAAPRFKDKGWRVTEQGSE